MLVRWSQWDENYGMVNCGNNHLEDIEKNIKKFEKKAFEVLQETGAKHIVYAAKYYDSDGELEEVRFYMLPADEERFDSILKIKNVKIYALHG